MSTTFTKLFNWKIVMFIFNTLIYYYIYINICKLVNVNKRGFSNYADMTEAVFKKNTGSFGGGMLFQVPVRQ